MTDTARSGRRLVRSMRRALTWALAAEMTLLTLKAAAVGFGHALESSSAGFTIVTAIAIVGYVAFPLLMILAPGLLLVALLLLLQSAIERREDDRTT